MSQQEGLVVPKQQRECYSDAASPSAEAMLPVKERKQKDANTRNV
jgi:hypothetical protein